MSMSKKDFIALADVIKAARPNADEEPEMAGQWAYMKEVLADFCEAQNPNFMRKRWMDYIAGKCGPNGGSIKS